MLYFGASHEDRGLPGRDFSHAHPKRRGERREKRAERMKRRRERIEERERREEPDDRAR